GTWGARVNRYDLQLRRLACKAQDGGDEVRATLPEQPLGANDQVPLRQDVADGLLPRKLGPAVNVERTDRIVLAVRAGRPTVEHVVGADVQQTGARVARGAPEVRRPSGVDALRGVGLR